jgi:hypothetical protein
VVDLAAVLVNPPTNSQTASKPSTQGGRLPSVGYANDLADEKLCGEAIVLVPKIGRFTLTVAHLDHTPENCGADNLRAWCSVCHCRNDLRAMPTKRMLKREFGGQLKLFG